MQFVVNVGKFLESLESVVNVSSKNTIKDFESAFNIFLDVKQNYIEAKAYGGNMGVVSIISNDNIDDLKFNCIKEGDVIFDTVKFLQTMGSFDPIKNVSVKANGKEIIVSLEDDEEEYQSFPVSQYQFTMPTIADSFNKKIKINREVFIDGMEKTAFAIGDQETKPQFLCQVLETNKNYVRFVAGTGSRFAVNEIRGKGIVDDSGKNSVIFPRHNISNIISSLKNGTIEQIEICEAFSIEGVPDQILIKYDDTTLVLLGIDTNLKKYQDVNLIFDLNFNYEVKTKIGDWQYPTKGIGATFSEEVRKVSQIHNAEFEIDSKHKVIKLKANTNMKSVRKIPCEIIKNGEDNNFSVKFNSFYLGEMMGRKYSTGDFIFKFIDEIKPIVVIYPELEDQTKGTTEKFTMFFATSSK